MRLVLVGPPGSGKGTQAEKLVRRLGLTPIGTGDILRRAIQEGTPLGREVEPLLKQGLLVPDTIVNDLVAELFRGPNPPTRFVTDGYPRTYAQAIAFDALLAQQFLRLDAAIDLAIPDEEVVRRISGRRCCSNVASCGVCYNVFSVPPKAPGVCDVCGSPLIQRDDDREETVRRRLLEFHKNTDALIEHYRTKGLLREIPATDLPETIYANILRAVGKGE
ncbi:MAG TPA: adenylate kinase [Gemmataceae bacterium]|nr:adenylate kinase [Gemmataceae bacterium]